LFCLYMVHRPIITRLESKRIGELWRILAKIQMPNMDLGLQ